MVRGSQTTHSQTVAAVGPLAGGKWARKTLGSSRRGEYDASAIRHIASAQNEVHAEASRERERETALPSINGIRCQYKLR
jgi:hypothetical protein